MRSPTCLLESRIYSSKNLRSTVQKDFYNTIGTKRTYRHVSRLVRFRGAKRTSGKAAACFGPTRMTTHNGPRPQRHAHRPHPVECDDISRCEADQVETGG